LLARAFPGRSGKQCRERWHNHVNDHIKKGEWTPEVRCERGMAKRTKFTIWVATTGVATLGVASILAG